MQGARVCSWTRTRFYRAASTQRGGASASERGGARSFGHGGKRPNLGKRRGLELSVRNEVESPLQVPWDRVGRRFGGGATSFGFLRR